ncbi:MAG: hypothetical protein M1818_007771 [Claussenomyces sp. TS43310]|nr:MAG: hypothetical protein M1818_007771 [Claussenomyces sp. TS43310]
MAALRAKSRLQVGSAPWITEERASALQMISSEAEEFSFSAKNELDWLNEHMAQIFDENQLYVRIGLPSIYVFADEENRSNVTELFKTPGKLRGKTPRVARKNNPLEARAPLSDVFSATPHGPGPNPFRKQQAVRQAPKFSVAEDASEPPKQKPPPLKSTSTEITNFDSGYHGSQASIATDVVEQSPQQVPHPSTAKSHLEPLQPLDVARQSDDRRTTEESFQSAKEDQTVNVAVDGNALGMIQTVATEALMTSASRSFEDPVKSLEIASSPRKPTSPGLERRQSKVKIDSEPTSNQAFEDIQSPSDGSSPVRPIRHSSLSFATLPPREPLNTNAKKSIGNRTSRTSHLDRTSYYGRNTGGKSLGSRQVEDVQDEEDSNLDLNLPEISKPESDRESKMTRMHNKTSTQRLQDQISMLGKSQSNVPRPSKSIPSIVAAASQKESQHVSPARHDPVVSAPGAFPAEEDDDWIEPQTQSNAAPAIFSPRPELTKSHTLAVMDSVHDQDDASVFAVPKQRSPVRDPVERTVSPLGLTKYASTSVITSPSKRKEDYSWYLKKGVSVSNPNLASHSGRGERSPSKSPSRSLRDSPLKAAKDKISSILKTSRSLFASSAAVSADAHCSTLSGPSTRSAQDPARDSIQDHATNDGSLYPSLDAHQQPDSPSKSGIARRTRASTEREERRKEKEAKEARMMNEQLEKLEKLREKESQKARVFSQEQERVISMKKQIAVQKEQEKHGKPATVESPRATRSSPRKVKGQLETEGKIAVVSVAEKSDRDVNMVDAPKDMPPPAVPRPASQMSKISKDHSKRVAKPGVHPPTRGPKTAPAPVHIKVHTGVHGGPHRNPLHPSNTALASSLGDSLAPAASKSNATGPSLSHKVSTSSMKSTVSTSSATKKPAALAAAARKKEQAS